MKNKFKKLKAISTFSLVSLCSSLSLGQNSIKFAGCAPDDFVQGKPNNTIATSGTSYTPKCLRVKAGASVTIQASEHHPLSALPSVSGETNPFSDQSRFVSSQTRIMERSGLFGYFCEVHGDSEGDGMAGAILVE